MNDNQAKFQSLLRELFQFDCADLDFGIYRIMNHKRAVIERFISKELPQAITEELERGALAKQAKAMQALEAAREKVLETLGDDAIDADGNLVEKYRNTKAGKEYLAAREAAAGARERKALEAAVYNHLYTFFNRYWQDGDFISKRRYSKKERYAIPYNGEEVYLYWANHDQYYVKTGEYFTDYTYKAPNGVTVHFKLRQADVEQNNVKGEKRFFLPRLDEITWDEAARQVVIPFEYRPLTAQEAITYGQKNQQEAIIAKAVKEIPKHPGNADVSSALEYHLRQYTRRNTSDFFIHKDLKGFLARELDFYLKNEVLNLDEMEAAGENLAEGWFQLMRLIKRVGLRIIKFLAQIEDFQKMLWEKKKFVTEVFYLVTVGHVPEVFYPEIAACEAQWDEWKQLGIPIPGIADVSSAKNENVIPGIADVSSAKNENVISASSEKNLHKGWHTRGYLPHFDAGNILQFITFRLADSVPSEVIDQWKQELRWHEGMDAASKEAVELRKRIEKYEDSGKGACYLRDERIARLVEDALKRFNGERYRLIAWCIMPNHVHVLIKMMDAPLPDIVKEWKSYTAHAANKILGRSGTFWMPDYFDRYIRDEEHFRTTVDYIFQNPVQAGLVDAPEKWLWSGFIPENAGNASVSDADSAALAASGARAGGRDVRDPRNPRIQFLKSHPTLVLDTRHFPQDFTDRLLASFDNLDEVTDGLLVHSENWQALNLLQEKYRERVKCIHIDPPYNTQTSGFLYKNDYQHSSWLAMMENRLWLGWLMVRKDGALACHIDENEYESLYKLCEHLSIPIGGTVVWDKKNPMLGRKGVATQHEYVLWLTQVETPIYLRRRNVRMILAKAAEVVKKHGGVNDDARREFASWVRNAEGLSGGERAYSLLDDDGRIFQSVSMEAPEPRTDPKFFVPLIHPVTQKQCPVPRNGWSRAPETIKELLQKNEILFGRDETNMPRRKVFLTDQSRRQLSSVISGSGRGKNDVDRLGFEFPYCHPVSLYEEIVGACTDTSDADGLVLDFFAGSGTTGHAVINLNREDGGRRKFILVEMADYFDTVLLPRIKKVTFTPEWKDGKPKRMATQEEAERSPRLVKVIRLESYEDALNNLTFEEQSSQQALQLFRDDYLLSYMLRWETRQSETLLNVEKLQSPFSYKLHLHRDGETRERTVDLPETFNYLLGLDVQRRKVYINAGGTPAIPGERYAGNAGVSPAQCPGNAGVSPAQCPGNAGVSPAQYLVYRGRLRNGRTVVILWRDITGWGVKDYEREAAFVAEQKLTAGADEIYVNGDSRIPGARSLDPIFKERMFATMEA